MTTADLHIHSSCSDGSDSVPELAQKIKVAGINIFALTDHDTIEGCKEMEKIVPAGIKFIKGIELTCIAGSIKCHILGYGCRLDNEELNNLIEKGKKLRREKLEKRIAYLKEFWNIELTKDELDWLYSRKSVVKTHIANVLVNRSLANYNIDAMKKYLDGCKTGNTRFDIKEAVSAIKSAGGIVVWAHPLGGEGEVHLTKEEFLPKLKEMLKHGIQGLECYYSRYSKKEVELLIECARKNNLYISGGSDYHGTNKDIPLAKLNSDNIPADFKNFHLNINCI